MAIGDRRCRGQGRGEPGGEPQRGDVDEDEEGADVQRPEGHCLPPPVAAGQAAGEEEQDDPDGQGPERCTEERMAVGQEVRRDEVRGPPRDRRNGGE